MATYDCNPNIQELEIGDQKVRVIVDYMMSSRLTMASETLSQKINTIARFCGDYKS